MRTWVRGWLLCALIVACGDGSSDASSDAPAFAPDVACGAAFSLAGGLELSVAPMPYSTACGSVLAETGQDTLEMRFILDAEQLSLSLDVPDVPKGQTGPFSAELRVAHLDGREWQTQCLADLTEHAHHSPVELAGRPSGEYYRVAGTVSCADPAPALAGSGAALEIQELSFVTLIHWI